MSENDRQIDVIKEAQTVGGALKVIIPVALGMFLVGFDSDLYFFGGTFITRIIHVNPFYIGVASSGFAAGIAIFSIIGGYIFDKITTRNGIIISLAIISIFSTLTGFVTNEYELVAYRFIVGFGTGMIQPEIIAFLGDIKPKLRQTVIASEGIAFGLGLFVAPYIFAAYSTFAAFDIPFIIAGIAGLLLIVLVLALVPSKYKAYKKPEKSMIEIINKPLIFISGSFLFFGISFFAFESYATPYMEFYGFSKGAAAAAFSTFGLALLIATLPGGIIGDKFKRKLVIIASAIIMVIANIIMFIKTPTFLVITISIILFGAGYGIYGNVAAFAQETVEDQWRGSAVGFMFLIFNIGSLVGGTLMGTAISLVGYRLAGLYVMIIPMILSFILITLTPRIKVPGQGKSYKTDKVAEVE